MKHILDILFPARCAVCDRVLSFGQQDICTDCKGKIKYLGNQVCLRCGKEVKTEEEYCYDCRKRSHIFDQGRAVFSYEFIRLSLYRFKYAGRKEYARFYAKSIAARLKEQKEIWQPQALLPVPLHPGKKIKTIIIMDDIYTTGSTMDAVAKECRKAGIEKIYFITVSIGNGL